MSFLEFDGVLFYLITIFLSDHMSQIQKQFLELNMSKLIYDGAENCAREQFSAPFFNPFFFTFLKNN